jgi:hypothetical protein
MIHASGMSETVCEWFQRSNVYEKGSDDFFRDAGLGWKKGMNVRECIRERDKRDKRDKRKEREKRKERTGSVEEEDVEE